MTSTQRIFDPCVASGNDGWIEIATTVGVHQPPNRALPAPIFRDTSGPGSFYAPHNGATGNWAISKTVVSAVAGLGQLVLGAGTYPCTGGLYADDGIVGVRVNGVQAPFTYGGVVAGPAVVGVTWLAGNNTVEIEVTNTIAGATSLGGLMDAVTPTSTSPLPCDCCNPIQGCRALVSQLLLDAPEAIITNGTGAPILPLSRWSDGDVAGANFTGWTSPGVQFTAVTSPVIDLSFTVPQNGITGIRSWVQGGGDLNDSDGFASWDFTLFDSIGNILSQGNQVMGNGGAPFTHNIPGAPVNGVSRMRLSNMRKTNGAAGVAPLVREVELLQTLYSTVFRCRDAQNGAVTWYDVDGNLVPNSQVVACPENGALVSMTAVAPFAPQPGIRMTTAFFGDDGGTGENACNVTPAPTLFPGFTLVGACYDPTPGALMDWLAPPPTSIQWTYDSNGSALSGASLFAYFANSAGGFYTWTANGTPMVAGEQRVSLPAADGSFIRATQLPFTGPALGALRMDGGNNLRIGPPAVSNFGAYPMLFEWLK